MQINIKATNYELGADTRAYAEKKLGAIEKFLDESQGVVLCDVELEHETAQQHGRIFRAEINLNAHGEFFRVEESAESMQAAIDAAHDEILRRLKKGKTKHMSMIRRGGAKLKEMMNWGKSE